MSDTSPFYVTSYCQFCKNGIEFDAGVLTTTNYVIECPHCQRQTALHLPPERSNPTQEQETRLPDEKTQRVILSKSQRESPIGRALINLLTALGNDGVVTFEEIQQLDQWLQENGDPEIPAFAFLARLVTDVLKDGEVTPEETVEIQLGIERVLPKSPRAELKEKRLAAFYNSPASENQLTYLRSVSKTLPANLTRAQASELIEHYWQNVPATDKQLRYISDLGGNAWQGITKTEASGLIEQLLGDSTPLAATQRQMMVLRFWNRLDLAHLSKDEIMAWTTQFYDEDPRRKVAWEVYKAENANPNSQGSSPVVPLGVGELYLNKVAGIFTG